MPCPYEDAVLAQREPLEADADFRPASWESVPGETSNIWDSPVIDTNWRQAHGACKSHGKVWVCFQRDRSRNSRQAHLPTQWKSAWR